MKNYKKSNRKGFRLEEEVSALFEPIFKYSKPTKNSGATYSDGDIVNPYFMIECKQRSTNNITINSKVWKKLCGEIPIGSLKIPLYILSNIENEKWVVLNLKDFINMVNKLYKE